MFNIYTLIRNFIACFLTFGFIFSNFAFAEWSPDWTARKKISIDAQAITGSVSQAPVVVRLHSGNFDFTTVNVDGSDVRFIAADDKTELKYYVEKFDAVNELAIIWVQVPTISRTAADAYFWLYYGNEVATSTSNAKAVLVWLLFTLQIKPCCKIARQQICKQVEK